MPNIPVIIKYKMENSKGCKYRAGSIVELPLEEAEELIKRGDAVPQSSSERQKREKRVLEPSETRAPINNKRLNQLKVDKEKAEKMSAKAEPEVESEPEKPKKRKSKKAKVENVTKEDTRASDSTDN